MSYLVRVYSSERLSSSHGPDMFYEIVHAHVRHEPNAADGTDVVMLRMIQADRPNQPMVAEIHTKDLMEVEERMLVFMDRVRKKAGDSSSIHPMPTAISPIPGIPITQATPQPAPSPFLQPSPTPQPMMSPYAQQPQAQPVPAAEPVGRFAPGAPRKKIAGLPEEMGGVRSGPKKSSFGLDAGGNVISQTTPQPGSMQAIDRPPTGGYPSPSYQAAPTPAPTPIYKAPSESTPYEIVAFSLQKPPDLEAVLATLSEDPQRLVVVARMELHDKIKTYLENVIRGDGALAGKPGAFSAIVLHRQGGRINFKGKMSGPLALAIQQIVANPTKVLWVPPEGTPQR